MANIEKPAAIFSEEGLKMFIEALTGKQEQSPDNEVDSLVKEYKDYKAKEIATEDIDAIILEALRVPRSGKQIIKILNENGFKYNDGRAVGPLMRGFMSRNKGVIKEGQLYSIEGNADE